MKYYRLPYNMMVDEAYKLFMASIDEFGCTKDDANHILRYLISLMSGAQKKYHTLAHILTILDFAKENNISLSKEEKLAIWFHDAVYWIKNTPHKNEDASALIWLAFAPRFTKVCAFSVKTIIQMTANFMVPDITMRDCHGDKYLAAMKVMDLDLCNFAMSYDDFDYARRLVQEELGTSNQDSINFYIALQKRGPIFRSEKMKLFEAVAQYNIAHSINQISLRPLSI